MIDRLLAKIRKRYRFSAENEAMLRAAMTETITVDRDQVIVPENRKVGHSLLLLEGLSCRATYVEDGGRQIMEINVPGDFVDLHSYPLEWLDHNVAALTRCTLLKLPHKAITEMIAQDQRLGRIFWFATMLDASIHREWLVSLGRRSALARLAHMFCELHYRLDVVGLVEPDGSYDLPIRQADIANALGLTPVHVSRMLRELREMGLCTLHEGRVRIPDLTALERTASFDRDYLFLEPRES